MKIRSSEAKTMQQIYDLKTLCCMILNRQELKLADDDGLRVTARPFQLENKLECLSGLPRKVRSYQQVNPQFDNPMFDP